MAFAFNYFIATVLFHYIRSQSTHSTQPTYGTDFVEYFTSQVEGNNISATASTIVTPTEYVSEVYEIEYNFSSTTNLSSGWNNATFSEEATQEERSDSFSTPFTSVDSSKPTYDNLETNLVFETNKLENNTNETIIFNSSVLSTKMLYHNSNDTEYVEEKQYTVREIYNDTTSVEWNTKNSSRESPRYTTSSSNKKKENILMVLKSNCSTTYSENNTQIEDFFNLGCTIYLRVNFSSENQTHDELLRILEKLTIKLNEFEMVEIPNQNEEDASGQKQHNKSQSFMLDPEAYAYLAVAIAFAFLLLLAIIVFGFRCFKKRRPSMDISRFDVRLSSYTLSKIPRASLTSLDGLHELDKLDDKPGSSTGHNKDYESFESSLDVIPCDTYSSNREMKTFGVATTNSRNIDSPSDMYPQHSPIAYENHTFQRYF